MFTGGKISVIKSCMMNVCFALLFEASPDSVSLRRAVHGVRQDTRLPRRLTAIRGGQEARHWRRVSFEWWSGM